MAVSKDDLQRLLQPDGRPANGEHGYGAIPINDETNGHRLRKKTSHTEPLDRLTACILIACVTCITTLGSLLNGMVVVAIPSMAKDLNIASNLILWPASIHALTSGCTLLICGSIADVLGSRPMYIWGCILQFAVTLGCGLSRNGLEIILFRALAGLAASFCLPSAVSVVNSSFPNGRWRSVAFACMGGGQPVGFAVGLVMGGIFSGTIGWQWGFHIAAIINFSMIIIAAWKLPKNAINSPPISWKRLMSDIDWVGALLASTSLAMLFYLLAIFADEKTPNMTPINTTLIVFSLALFICFIIWVSYQESRSRPALIPNSIWRNKVFTSICINVFLTWGSFNALEQFLNLYFQEVQHHSGLGTALRFLPTSASGLAASLFMGFFVHLIRADYLVFGAGLISALSPLLLALVDESWSYWSCVFPAIVLNPLGVDALFTISILLISSIFPDNMQGLAGGVFNTVNSVGKSMGLAVAASIANNVTAKARRAGGAKTEEELLMLGYKAAFWFCLASVLVTLGVSAYGLRKIGKVGHESKQEGNGNVPPEDDSQHEP